MYSQKEVGLCFAGGGCSIIYYTNLLRIIQGQYTPVAYTGVSSGCFISMPAAAGYTPEEIEHLLQKHYAEYNKLILKPKWHLSYGFCSNEQIGRIMGDVCRKKGIEKMSDFKIPIIVKSVNAQTGSPIYFSNLDIPGVKVIHNASPAEAVMASTAFPGIYKGVWVADDDGNRILCTDGGARGNICCIPLKHVFPNLEIWACKYSTKKSSIKKSKHFFSIMQTLVNGAMRALTDQELLLADKVLEMQRIPSIKMIDPKAKHFDQMRSLGDVQIRHWFD